jgi:cephalosporin hydroxylase
MGILRDIIGRRRKGFSLEAIYEGHHRTTYRGVKALRCPFDYVIYQMIVCELRPDLLVEIGTHTGGGALYLADLMNNIGHGAIHSIDVVPVLDPAVLSHQRITLFSSGWEGYDLALVRGYENVLVIEDSTHTYENTLKALHKFSSVVTPGSYLIVEDGIVGELGMAGQFKGGPLRAIQEFLHQHSDFEVDRKWCDFFGPNATFNVDGYLRRKAT